jgi:hypothetical protein
MYHNNGCPTYLIPLPPFVSRTLAPLSRSTPTLPHQQHETGRPTHAALMALFDYMLLYGVEAVDAAFAAVQSPEEQTEDEVWGCCLLSAFDVLVFA